MKKNFRYLLAIALPLALLAILWIGLWFAVGSNILPRTSLLGVDISKMTVDSAIKKVAAAKSSDLTEDITLVIDSKKYSLPVKDSGVSLDIAASIEGSANRTWNPISLISALFSNKKLEPKIVTDQAKFDRAIRIIEQKVTVAPKNADIIFEGITPKLVRASDGKLLPQKKSLKKIEETWLRSNQTILTLKKRKAKILDDAAQELIPFATQATSGPLTIKLDVEKPVIITVSPDVIAQSLTFIPGKDGKLEAKWLKGTFVNLLGKTWTAHVIEPVNASFIISNGEPRVQPSRDGSDIPEEKLNALMLGALAKQGSERSISVTPENVPAKITTEMAGGLGIKEVIGSFTTYYPYAEYRIANIHRAAKWMDGVIVKPGEVFSYNKAVGERTEARGFVPGIMIDKGVFKKDWGGGVSQVATTTWNAAWFSGLELLQHKPHSFYISRYPPGRESTVAWPSVDVKFRNNSGHPIFVDTSYTNNSVTVTIYGTKFVEVETETGPRIKPVKFKVLENDAEECLFQEGVPGFTIDVWRILKRDGVEIKREKYRTNYRPEDRIICTNPNAKWMNPPLSVQRSLTS